MSIRGIGSFARLGGLRPWLMGLAMLTAAAPMASAMAEQTILHRFKNGRDGALPYAGLIIDESGALYGTTSGGGSYGGTVFRLTPPAPPATRWTETVLYRFKGGEDGSLPIGRLVRDDDGSLYGTTSSDGGGDCFFGAGCGTVFKLTPPAAPGADWVKTTLHRFEDADEGGRPQAGLLLDRKGALYGTTYDYGCCGFGTVFKLTPPRPPSTRWRKSVLYRFEAGADGAWPYAGLAIDKNGALYGTTIDAGDGHYGRVFMLTPPTAPGTTWTKFELHRFKGGKDGARPQDGLVLDKAGVLYGTTTSGGRRDVGVIYRVAPPKPPSVVWTTDTIYQFGRQKDGVTPFAGLAMDRNGVLYGTTTYGGSHWGTVFKLSPSGSTPTEWTHTVLHRFKGSLNGQRDGGYPRGDLVLDSGGAIYGTTSDGGVNRGCGFGCGTVFKID